MGVILEEKGLHEGSLNPNSIGLPFLKMLLSFVKLVIGARDLEGLVRGMKCHNTLFCFVRFLMYRG